MNKSLSIAALCILAAYTSDAQTLSTEITVDRTVATSLPQASPMPDVWPSMTAETASATKPQMADYAFAASFAPLVAEDKALLFNGIKSPDKRPGYLWAGYFPAYNLGAAAGYRFIDTQSTKAGASLSFNGLSYNSSVLGNEERKVSSNTFGAAVYASHRFGSLATVSIDADYSRTALKSPGYDDNSVGQGINKAKVALSVSRYTDNLSYSGSLRLHHLGLTDNIPAAIAVGDFVESATVAPASETLFGADAAVRSALGTYAAVNVGFAADILHNSGLIYRYGTFAVPDRATQAIISVDPAIEFRRGAIDVRVGIKLDVAVNTIGSSFHIAPDLGAVVRAGERLSFYTSFGGGQQFNTLAQLYNYSAFAPDFSVFAPRYTPVDARAGFRLGSFGGVTADVHAGYACSRNVPMPVELIVPAPLRTFAAVDLSGWYAGLQVDYTLGKIVKAGITANVYPHNYSSGNAAAPDRAKYTGSAYVSGQPLEALNVEMRYTLRAQRRYYNPGQLAGHAAATDMGNVSNLQINANYAFSNNLSVFLRLDNLLARRQLILPGLAAQGFNGLAGVGLRF